MHDVHYGRNYSVLIIGGGPAGLATAMELVRCGIAATVIERSTYNDVRIGEHLTPAGVLQLRALDPGLSTLTSPHGRSAGVTAYWGSTAANHTDYFLHPGQGGLNLSRPRFDTELAQAAETSGATVLRSASLKLALRTKAGWAVDVEKDGRIARFVVPFIVDATGHVAKFSRQQGAKILVHDRQVALVAFQDSSDDAYVNTRSIVETAEDGWWYHACIKAPRSVCMFITDSDLLPGGGKHVLYDWWLQQLGRAHHMPRQSGKVTDFFIRSASSQCLDVPVGLGWLAVGDAAMAFDPLASQGIAKALNHGSRAASAIFAHFRRDELSLMRFAEHLRREYVDLRFTRAQYYQLESRWPRSTFWRRRNRLPTQEKLSELEGREEERFIKSHRKTR